LELIWAEPLVLRFIDQFRGSGLQHGGVRSVYIAFPVTLNDLIDN
jgi:hypothetical protein